MMDHSYAKQKLTLLARDISQYTADEFRRQMARITSGATGQDVPDDCHTIKAERDALQQENAKLHGRINDAEQRIVAEQRWSTDRLRGVRADAILQAVRFFKGARDIDVEALKAYAEKVRQGGAK